MKRVVLTALALCLATTQVDAQSHKQKPDGKLRPQPVPLPVRPFPPQQLPIRPVPMPIPIRPIPIRPIPIRPIPIRPTPIRPRPPIRPPILPPEVPEKLSVAAYRLRLAARIVEASPTGTADKADVKVVMAQLLELPTSTLRRLYRQGTNVVVTRDSVAEHLTEFDGLETSEVTALYDREDDTVVISVVDGEINGEGFELLRTLGYALDPASHYEGRVGSNSPAFLRAYKREVANGNLEGVLRDPREAFAEAFALNASGQGEELPALQEFFGRGDPLSPVPRPRPRPPIGINPHGPKLPGWPHKLWPRPWKPLWRLGGKKKVPGTKIEIQDLPKIGEAVGESIGRTVGGIVGEQAERIADAIPGTPTQRFRVRAALEDKLGQVFRSPWEAVRDALPVVAPIAPIVPPSLTLGLPLPVIGKVAAAVRAATQTGKKATQTGKAKDSAPAEPEETGSSKGLAGALQIR